MSSKVTKTNNLPRKPAKTVQKVIKTQKQRKSTQLGLADTKPRVSKKRRTENKVNLDEDNDEDGPTTQVKKKIRGIDDLITLKAGEVFQWIYGINPKFEYINKEKTVKKSGLPKEIKFSNARDWWERTPAISQCANTVGKREDTKECYICGLPINNDSIDENTPECEHILPVFLGSLLLTLYRTELNDKAYKSKLESIPRNNIQARKLQIDLQNQIKNELGMEYDWAHRCCNQIKKDTSFIKFDREEDKFVFNYVECKEMLEKIKGDDPNKSPPSYCKGNINKAINKKDKEIKNKYINVKGDVGWVSSRLDIIGSQRINPICNYLNRSLGVNGKGIFYLSILASLISSADLRVIKLAQDKSGYTTTRNAMVALAQFQQKTPSQITRSTENSKVPRILQEASFKESIITANIYHSFSDFWAKRIEMLKKKFSIFGGKTTHSIIKSFNINQTETKNKLYGEQVGYKFRKIGGENKTQKTKRKLEDITSNNSENLSQLSESQNNYKTIYKVTSTMFGKTFLKNYQTDYTTTYKYILSSLMSNSFVKRHGTYKVEGLEFQYSYFLRDLISILYFTNYSSSSELSIKDNFNLIVNVSTTATKFATVCIFYLNLVSTSSLSKSPLQNITSVYKEFIDELTSLLQTYKKELIEESSSVSILYNYVSFITNVMISNITGVSNLTDKVPVILESTVSLENMAFLLSYQNVLYCRMEYYKNYSEQYTKLVTNAHESFGDNDDSITNSEIIAVNILEGFKNGTIDEMDIRKFVKSPNKDIISNPSKSVDLIAPIVTLSPPQAKTETNEEYNKRVETANTLIQMHNMESAVDILPKIKSRKLSFKEQSDWAESLKTFYEKNEKIFFKENPDIIINNKMEEVIKELENMSILPTLRGFF